MKLTPIARAIRFRIVCGGEEHRTLASLKEHFVLSEIMDMIKEERLQHWLKQLGEDKDIKVDENMNGIDVFKAFFPEYKYKKSKDIIPLLYNDKKICLATELLKEEGYIATIKQLYNTNQYSKINWEDVFDNLINRKEGCKDGDIFFWAGKSACESHHNQDYAIRLLKKAAELGNNQAKPLIEQKSENPVKTGRFRNLDKKKASQNVKYKFEYGKEPNTASPIEREAIEFANQCSNVKYLKNSSKSDKNEKVWRNSYLKKSLTAFINKKNVFYPEYKLIYEIAASFHGVKIPQDWFLDVKNKSILVQMRIKKRPPFDNNTSFCTILNYIIEHLFDE